MPPQSPAQQRQIVLNERGAMASPAAPNLLKPQLYLEALREVSPIQPGKRPTAGLVIPDYAVRMAVIDLEEFPSGEDEQIVSASIPASQNRAVSHRRSAAFLLGPDQ